MTPISRPTEWAGAICAAVINVLIAAGVDVSAKLAASITALVVVVTTAAVAARRGRALPPDQVTAEDLSDGYQADL